MLFLAIVTCLAFDISEDVEDDLFCAKKYLQAKGLLNSKLRAESTHLDENKSNCTEIVKTIKKSFYNTIDEIIRSILNLETIPQEVAACSIEKAKKQELADLALKLLVYNNEYMSQRKTIETIDAAIKKKAKKIAKVCMLAASFKDLLYNACKKSGKSPVDDYCIRKYLAENNFINTTIHRIDLNQQNVDVIDTECKKVVASAKTEAIVEWKKEFGENNDFESRHSKRCLLKSIYGSKYFEIVIKATVLCNVTMTPEIEEHERGQFIKGMESLYETIYLC